VANNSPLRVEDVRQIPVRRATPADAADVAQLLHDFNVEFETPTPGVEFLSGRLAELIEAGEMDALVAGDGPEGVGVLRFRPALWSDSLDAYLEELYVVPKRRDQGIGTALMDAAMALARERGAGLMSINVDEEDVDTRRFYERLGFRNHEGNPEERMFFYEREL
jgi:ribosomal protein S18 acetylase RimI-like enzyme